MFTDALIRGWQTTHEGNVSGIPFFSLPPPKKKPPDRSLVYVLPLHFNFCFFLNRVSSFGLEP